MNNIVVFEIEYSKDIEYTVNRYCKVNKLTPISINVCVPPSFHPVFIVSVVVKPIEQENER